MAEPVGEGKGAMISHEKTRGGEWKIYRFTLLVLVAMGIVGLLVVEKSMAQLSPNTVSYAITGSALPFVGGGFTPILSRDGIRAGPFRVHPFLGAGEIYTDNVFRTKSNRQSDFVHIVSPGLQVQLPFAGKHQAVIDYRATQWFSQRFSENNVLRQDLTGQVLLNFPGGLNLHLQGGYRKGFDLRGSALDVQALEPTKWNTKTFVGEAETIGNQLGVRLRVQTTDWNYENNNQAPTRDRLSSRGNFTVFGLIAPKTFALLNFGVTRNLYDQNTQLDSTNYNVNTGLRWRATGKINGEIQVGYTFLTFDHAPVLQPAGSPLSSGGTGSNTVQVSGNLTWQPTPRLTIGIRPFRSIRQSGVFGTSVFTQTAVNLTVSHAIGIRTTLNGNLRFSNNDFDNDQGNQSSQNREDNILGAGIGVTYQAVRWLGIRGQYQYQQRNSTINTFENYANTLMVSIQGVF